MLKSKTFKDKVFFYAGYDDPEKMKRKVNDGRRRRRRTPALNPWRQYKLSEHAFKS